MTLRPGDAKSWTAPDSAPMVIPDPKTTRVVGNLNILFGSILIVMNLTSGAMYLIAPIGQRVFGQFQDRFEASLKQDRDRELQQLRDKEAAEADPAKKAAIVAQRESMEAWPAQTMPMRMEIGFSSINSGPARLHGLIDTVTGLMLNVAMIVVGVGLIHLNEWGRKGAILVASLKIGRLAMLTAYSVLVLAPLQAAVGVNQMKETLARAPAPPPGPIAAMGNSQVYMSMIVAGLIFNALVAAVFPTIVLVLLNRSRCRAACDPGKPLAEREWSS